MKRVTYGAVLAITIALLATPSLGKDAKGEGRLAKLLEGRTAGQPVDCISLTTSRDTEVISKTAIVYGSGRVIYVNRPGNPESLNADDILVVHPTGSELCRLDMVQTRDRTSRMFAGSIFLQKFVPWTRVSKAAAAH